jgi:hypothetical protein
VNVSTATSTSPTAQASGVLERPWVFRVPLVPWIVSALLFAFLACKPVAANERLQWTFVGVATFVLLWATVLWVRGRASGRTYVIERNVVRAHYVQALVQGSIYAYWAHSSPGVITEAPLIVAQVLYLYAFDALMSWSRGKSFRLGYGALPIIFSTNLLLWFRADFYYFQFAMVTIGALGKQLLTWTRDGRRTHIFNPSVFGQKRRRLGADRDWCDDEVHDGRGDRGLVRIARSHLDVVVPARARRPGLVPGHADDARGRVDAGPAEPRVHGAHRLVLVRDAEHRRHRVPRHAPADDRSVDVAAHERGDA